MARIFGSLTAFIVLVGALPLPALAAEGKTSFTAPDMARVETVTEPVFTPDGRRIVYVLTRKGAGDILQSDIWSVPWSGGAGKPLTSTADSSEWQPSLSADGRRITFLSDRGKSEETQLWTMSAAGGAEQQATRLPGGISDYALAPDGRSAVVVTEVGAHVGSKAKTPPPIVIDRFQFKEDGRDLLDDRRQHLFRVDLASGKATALTSGDFDHWLPSWSPDGRSIAFVSKRCGDADRRLCSDVYVMPAEGGEVRRISTHEGADGDPEWEAGRPAWSPDSRRLVWLQAGDEKLIYYSPFQLAVADLDTGKVTHPGWIDRWFYQPRWSEDGRHILALVEQDRDTILARIDAETGAIDYLTSGRRFATGFAFAGGHIAVVDGDSDAPPELRALGSEPRMLSRHNQWLAERGIAVTRDVAFMSGGEEIHGQLVLPPDYREGQRLPLIVRLHGGPVYQFSHEFMIDWQVYAAHGYAVFAPNPRGSSGRGDAFARAQMAAWGKVDVADVSAGIDHLIAAGIADPTRIGVGGWSYGGILANYMIARDMRIRAAVSGAGMANFIGGYGVDEYARDYELELGAPWDKPDLWRALSYPFFEARRITAPTLYLCAAKDDNVPCTGSQQMYQALRSTGVPTRLVVYPGENHGLVIPSYIEDRMQRQLDWYDRYLRSAPVRSLGVRSADPP